MLSTAYRAAHPNLTLFSNALSTLQSAAYRGLTLFNSYMLYQLRLGDAARDAAKAKEEAERAERRYLDTLRLYGETAPETLKAKSDWIEASEKAREAAEKEAKAHQELNIWLGLTALTAAGMATQIAANFGKIIGGILAVKTALTGLAASLTASTLAVGALTAGAAVLAAGLAFSLANIVAHKDASESWREAAEKALESLKAYPPVLKEVMEALTKAAGGWILLAEKISIFTSESASKILEWASGVREATVAFISTLREGFTSALTAIATWASEASNAVRGWSSSALSSASSFFSKTLSDLAGWVSSSASSFLQWSSRGLSEVLRFTSSSTSHLSAWVGEWLSKISTWASEGSKRFLEASSNFVKSLGEGLAGASAKVSEALTQIGSLISGFLSGLTGSAWSWGYRIVSSIADGIRAAIGAIVSAAQEVAQSIASILGVRSPAEEGPLSKLNEWGPNLVKTYAEGVRSSLSVLREAAVEAASTLSAVKTVGVVNVSVRVEGSSDIAREVSRRLAIELGRVMP